MANGIIVVDDIPVICAECNFAHLTQDKKYFHCNGKNKTVYNAKPDWCPIIPSPERANHEDYCDNGRYDKGWNDCLDRIFGREK